MASNKYKSVSELTQEIQDTLECDFSQVTVCGEVSGFHAHRSGHWYLTLKDDRAQLSAVVWRSSVARQRIQVEDGLQVVVRGRLTVYAPRGNYQLIVDRIEPLGEGSLRAAFRRLHQKLEAEGLFQPERKKPLPALPQRVVVITSPSGAAIRDFLQVATRRWRGTDILILPTRVQGQGAGVQLAAAVKMAEQLRPAADIIVLTRGGGSIEDLWEFNNEHLVRAIADCSIPVVSGVGHEIDVTLCDLVADLRALTPSEAAERVFPDGETLRLGLQQTQTRMRQVLHRQCEVYRRQLEQLQASRALLQPGRNIESLQQRLDELSIQMDRNVQRTIRQRKEQLAAVTAQLEGLSPLNVLSRGYSLTFDDAGRPISEADQLKPGQKITTRLKRGRVHAVVERVESAEQSFGQT